MTTTDTTISIEQNDGGGWLEIDQLDACLLASVQDARDALDHCADEGWTGNFRIVHDGDVVETRTITATATGAWRCEPCDVLAETRTCDRCGLVVTVIDCGHHAQPAAITHDGQGGPLLCADCAD